MVHRDTYVCCCVCTLLFFFNDTATTETYTYGRTLSLHDALPICSTAAELLSDGLTPDRLLFRLFHSEGVRAYQPQPVVDACRCSGERVEREIGRAHV